MVTPVDPLLFEELGLNAWPALSSVYYDRWLLTHNGGFTFRANAVYPFGESTLPLAEKIAYCESLYWGYRAPCIFKIVDHDQHLALDAALQSQHYLQDDPAAIMTVANLDTIALPTMPVHLTRRLTRRWLESYFDFSGRDPTHIRTMARMMALQRPAQRYAAVTVDGAIVSVGRVVIDRGWAGIYNLATAPRVRGRGLAREATRALLLWARQAGARSAYLQVGLANGPALRLYQGLGFQEYYRYWFRYKAAPADTDGRQ
jgi:ribosomal protein S18 acetylase RimI-like enzyme